MASYVMADVHGEANRFHAMLERIRFCDSDTLYIIGDVVDRGPDGIQLLQEIMGKSNTVMLLGNHEYMMLQYFSPDATETDIRRWNKNRNADTLAAFQALTEARQQEILSFLKALPSHLEVTVHGQRFYLVHGFPGENVHDEVWCRPAQDAPNPKPGYHVIIGHTKVSSLIKPEETRMAYLSDLEEKGAHMRIYHGPGFTDIDCGCGYSMKVKALACLRLDDMQEFYI